jgi:hypothetical protein
MAYRYFLAGNTYRNHGCGYPDWEIVQSSQSWLSDISFITFVSIFCWQQHDYCLGDWDHSFVEGKTQSRAFDDCIN